MNFQAVVLTTESPAAEAFRGKVFIAWTARVQGTQGGRGERHLVRPACMRDSISCLPREFSGAIREEYTITGKFWSKKPKEVKVEGIWYGQLA